MRISIITTCFNRASTIRASIESVLAQDYPDIEYIVVDGSSTDGSVKIIKEYEKHISKFVSEPDHGMYEAINKGIRMATGDVIGLIHSDDFYYDNHVVSRIAKRMEETGAELLYGNGLFVNHKDTNKIVRVWRSGKYRPWKVRYGWLPLHTTCYIRRDTMMKYGLYNEDYKIAADTDLLVRYLLKGDVKVTYLNEYVVKMRMGGLSTSSRRRIQMWHEDVRVYRSHGMYPRLLKVAKIMWKLPQFVRAKFAH